MTFIIIVKKIKINWVLVYASFVIVRVYGHTTISAVLRIFLGDIAPRHIIRFTWACAEWYWVSFCFDAPQYKRMRVKKNCPRESFWIKINDKKKQFYIFKKIKIFHFLLNNYYTQWRNYVPLWCYTYIVKIYGKMRMQLSQGPWQSRILRELIYTSLLTKQASLPLFAQQLTYFVPLRLQFRATHQLFNNCLHTRARSFEKLINLLYCVCVCIRYIIYLWKNKKIITTIIIKYHHRSVVNFNESANEAYYTIFL